MRLAGQSSPAAGDAASGQAASAQREGALLNETLSDASAPGALTTSGATLTGGAGAAAAGAQAGMATKGAACAGAHRGARAAHRAGLRRLARRIGIGAARCRRARRRIFAFFLLRGVDGQFTVQTRNGAKTLAFERGVIQSVSAGKSITVKASDGTTWTWGLVSSDGRARPAGEGQRERIDRWHARLGRRPGGPGNERRKAHSCPASAASPGAPILRSG